MKKVFVMCGFPGSGKSTWVRNNFHKLGLTTIVSRDDIRFMLVSENEEYFSKEKKVFDIFIEKSKEGIKAFDNVIIDATHINEASRRKLINALGDSLKDVELNAVVIKTPLELALERNEQRKGTRSYVPREVIRRMCYQFRMPTFEEGFDKIYVYDANKEGAKYTILEKENK